VRLEFAEHSSMGLGSANMAANRGVSHLLLHSPAGRRRPYELGRLSMTTMSPLLSEIELRAIAYGAQQHMDKQTRARSHEIEPPGSSRGSVQTRQAAPAGPGGYRSSGNRRMIMTTCGSTFRCRPQSSMIGGERVFVVKNWHVANVESHAILRSATEPLSAAAGA